MTVTKPEHNKTITGRSIYDQMSSLEQDTVTDIIERVCAEQDWDFNSIYWDLLIQNEQEENS
tara:strand:+ start:398 stop:583 length:186 start_codon:yes stop_codon:yes gene_type:complete